MKNFYVRFRLSGKDLIAEHDDIANPGKVVRMTFHDIKYITGSGNIIFMNETADTSADALVRAGIYNGVSFDPNNRHLYFAAMQISFSQEGPRGAYFFNVVGVREGEWLCVCANSVDKEVLD